MIEELTCPHCQRLITRLNLAVLRHVEMECPDCGAWNEYDYDPTKYVLKA